MNILYAYNPRTATLTVAKFVLAHYDIAIAAAMQQQVLAREQALALLDVLDKAERIPDDFDLETFLASGVQQGYDGGKLEALQLEQAAFRAALPADIKAQL